MSFDSSDDVIEAVSVVSPGFSDKTLLVPEGEERRRSYVKVEVDSAMLAKFAKTLVGPIQAPRGRPAKDRVAICDAYRKLFPLGHEQDQRPGGVGWKLALRLVVNELRTVDSRFTMSMSTLKGALLDDRDR